MRLLAPGVHRVIEHPNPIAYVFELPTQLDAKSENDDEDLPDMESIFDILFLQTPVACGWRIFAFLILILEYLVLAALVWELMHSDCTGQAYGVVVWYAGIPLCCVYAGVTLMDDFLSVTAVIAHLARFKCSLWLKLLAFFTFEALTVLCLCTYTCLMWTLLPRVLTNRNHARSNQP